MPQTTLAGSKIERVSNTYWGADSEARGAPIAIKAMAAKLARLVYRMLRCEMQFVDRGAKFYEAQSTISSRKPPS